MANFNCGSCCKDLYPLYEDEEQWNEGGAVKVISSCRVPGNDDIPTHDAWLAEITCDKCGAKLQVEDSTA